MKKSISLLLALVLCLSMCACAGNDTPETTEAPIDETKISKEDLLAAATPMTQDIVEQILADKNYAKTLISNTYTFTGCVRAEEESYVGVAIIVPTADGSLMGYDYHSALSFYVYLPAEELEGIGYDDDITIVGKITDVMREERKDQIFTDLAFPVTVIVMGDAYITE